MAGLGDDGYGIFWYRGTMVARSKLTVLEVLAIRVDSRSNTELAKIYGVSQPNISCIKSRKIWRHV